MISTCEPTEPRVLREFTENVSDKLPSVSVVIPNWNGASHLPDCLDSVLAVDYPERKLEVIVVDNGSTDHSRDLIATDYPSVRVVAHAENLGFAEGCNSGARAATSECIAFLNNDMRVEQGWLRTLIDGYEPDTGYVCVGGVILDWDGARVDFVRGWVNFHGHAGQDHFGEPVTETFIDDRCDLLFACGGSMLVGRDVFLELGGFDSAYFAFFEDVDFGWRLWVAGYKVRLAGRARSFHRHHGTAGALPDHRRALLYDRNALFTLIKNVGDENLSAILAAALFVLVDRAVIFTGSMREAFEFGSTDVAPSETVMRSGLASLHAVSDVLEGLPDLLARRSAVQKLRKRNDEEIFALFNRPFVPLSHEQGYLEASLRVRELFGLTRLFPRSRATRALVVMEGQSNRLKAFAGRLSPLLDVTSISPADGGEVLSELVAESDVVIADASTRHGAVLAQETRGLLLVDVGDGTVALDPALERRADILLGGSGAVKFADGPGDSRIVQIDPDNDNSSQALRQIVQEPWKWRRHRRHEDPVAVPEDFQQLLRQWREHYREGSRVRRGLRSIPIPPSLERALRRLFRRPRLRA